MSVKPEKSKRIRQSTKPLLNKLESEWYENLKVRFKIVIPQGMRFRLGNGIWYKPDFVCQPRGFDYQDYQDGRPRAFEVKGPHAYRGGFENLKVAAVPQQSLIPEYPITFDLRTGKITISIERGELHVLGYGSLRSALFVKPQSGNVVTIGVE